MQLATVDLDGCSWQAADWFWADLDRSTLVLSATVTSARGRLRRRRPRGRVELHVQDEGRSVRVEALDIGRRRAGLGTALMDHLERGWTQLGVRQVRLLAQHDGSVFWARRGYRFACADPVLGPAAVARHLLGTFGFRLEDLQRAGVVDAAEVAAFCARFATAEQLACACVPDGALSCPQQIDAYGADLRIWADADGRPTWLGREFLRACQWRAVKTLT